MYLNPKPELKALGERLFSYHGRKFQIVPAESMTLSSYWDGGSRTYYAVISQVPGEIQSVMIGECGGPFQPPPSKVALNPQTMVVSHHIFCGEDLGLTFYVHPSILPKYLPEPASLTRNEKIVLCATRSYKSTYAGDGNYRFHEARRITGINLEFWATAKTGLIAKGLLNKSGALTVDGKNAIGWTDLRSLKEE
jgi:hypothetical protein